MLVILQLFLSVSLLFLLLLRLLMMLVVSFDFLETRAKPFSHGCKCLGVEARKRFESERLETQPNESVSERGRDRKRERDEKRMRESERADM